MFLYPIQKCALSRSVQLEALYPEALLYEIWACLGQLGSFEWIYVKGMFSFLVGP